MEDKIIAKIKELEENCNDSTMNQDIELQKIILGYYQILNNLQPQK